MPTCAIAAPTLEEVSTPEGFTKKNLLLLRNTAAGNFLDCCGISLPCHAAGELPVGFMLMGEAMADKLYEADFAALISEAVGRAFTSGTAFAYGADAVYAGQTRYSLPSRFLDEIPEELKKWLTPRFQRQKPMAFGFAPKAAGNA